MIRLETPPATSPAEAGPAAAERRHRIPSAGVELAALELGERGRPTVVLVHGYPDTKEVWGDVARELARTFHVVTYDVRGAGASSAPASEAGYDLDRLEDDVLAVLDALAPGERVHLVGHDWGSLQGWRFATSARVAPRLRSYASLSGPCLDHVGRWVRDRPAGLGPLLRQAARSWYVGAMMIPGAPTLAWRVGLAATWPALLRRAATRDPGAVTNPLPPRPTYPRDGVQGVGLYRRNVPPALAHPREDATARVPVLLVVAEEDPYLSPALFDEVPRFAPTLRRRDVAGGHWLPRSHPALVARLVAEHADDVDRGAVRPGLDRRRTPLRYGQLALVTGAGSGIGRAISVALAEQGVRVLAVDRDLATAERTAALSRDLGAPDARALRADVGDRAAMEALARQVTAEHGALDILVNNAGVAVAGALLDTTPDEWRRMLDVNLWGVLHGCQLFAPAMLERGRGAIVNVASAAAFMPTCSLPAYATSKAAVLMYSESLRAELAPRGVRVTAVCPGIVNTNITRSARFAGKGEADEARLRAASASLYERRAFGPERVADAVLARLDAGPAVIPVTPEAHLLRLLGRLGPSALRGRVARIDPLAQGGP